MNDCLCSAISVVCLTQKLGKEDDIIAKLLAVQPAQKRYKIGLQSLRFPVRIILTLRTPPAMTHRSCALPQLKRMFPKTLTVSED